MKAAFGRICLATLLIFASHLASPNTWSQDRRSGLDAGGFEEADPDRALPARRDTRRADEARRDEPLFDDAGLNEPHRDNRTAVERRRLEPNASTPTTLDRGASINPDLLEVVKDNTLGLLYEERDLYFRLLKLSHETPLARQETFAAQFREARWQVDPRLSKRKLADFPTFVDLFQNPEEYRGRPVSLNGVIRKLTKFNPGKNSLGITEAYEGWVYTNDGQSNPAVVVFTSKPPKLPVGGDLTEEVRLTGYFLKMYGYDAQDVTRKAPLIIAGEVEWRPSQPKYVAPSLPLEIYFGITLIALFFGYAMWQANHREMTGRPRVQPEVDFSKFPPIEYSSTSIPDESETDDA
jgi:hypothetical protein